MRYFLPYVMTIIACAFLFGCDGCPEPVDSGTDAEVMQDAGPGLEPVCCYDPGPIYFVCQQSDPSTCTTPGWTCCPEPMDSGVWDGLCRPSCE